MLAPHIYGRAALLLIAVSFSLAHSERLAGLMSGLDGWVSDLAARAGAFLGASTGSLSVKSSQSIDWQSWFGGLYAIHELKRSTAGITLLGGTTSYSSSRRVIDNTASSGYSIAEGDYQGLFLSPELSLASNLGPFKTRLAARYAALFLDGYEEDGSPADLKVPDRTIHLGSIAAELAIPCALTQALTLTPHVAVEGRLSSSRDFEAGEIDTGQFFTLKGGGRSAVGRITAGSSLDYVSETRTFTWTAAVEGAASTDGALIAKASIGGELRF